MITKSLLFLAVLHLLVFVAKSSPPKRPHIIIILADDLGWNDLSFHGSDQIQTPNIDALAYNGVILQSHYVMPICTPSRSALMTGLYPIHNGMQGTPIRSSEPRAMPPGKIMPQYFKDLGYSTQMIGKWHLGFYMEEFTPTYRGFDSHLGYWNGLISYYDHIFQEVDRNNGNTLNGYDMRRNVTSAFDLSGRYATDMFTDEAVELIRTHPKNKPLFLYMSHLAVHAGNNGKFLEAPQDAINRFQHIADPNRRTFAAMVHKLDESVGRIISALEEANMLHNSVILFAADNGAPTIGEFPNWGSNYPLRGIKETLWEGGVRSASFIWSPMIKKTPRLSNELMHITDWLPTLYAAAGGNANTLSNLDGVNQWDSIVNDTPSERNEVLLNINEVLQTASIRMNSRKYNWKLVVGTIMNGSYDGYFGEGTNRYPENNPAYDVSAVINSKVYRTLERLGQKRLTSYPTPKQKMMSLRKEATVRCDYKIINQNRCNPGDGNNQVCLYDIKRDPCELNNLTPLYPNVASYLFRALVQYRETLVPQPQVQSETDLSNPIYFNGTWSAWLDSSGQPYVTLSSGRLRNFNLDPLNILGSKISDSIFRR
ncbi:hypothetical protein RUM43_012410 [Polyplax serrata]|uniref:Sulfatase N-terminal domain-containing protein n=1 Tax=Polyplax serrata TaxID=468196 RepID=A0AAN8P3P9_POLSC